MKVNLVRYPSRAPPRPIMPPIQSITVLLPTYQGARLLDRVLTALAGQECGSPWDLLVVDSGSTDETLEILCQRGGDTWEGDPPDGDWGELELTEGGWTDK